MLRGIAGLALAVVFPAAVAAAGFHGVHGTDAKDAWAVGDGGAVWRTLDGGLSWSSSALGPSHLRDVASQGLVVVVAGDSGKVWRSANSGGAWSLAVIPGTPSLRAISMPTATDAWIVGEGGVIARSADGGQTWTPQTSGTAQRLNAVRFVDATRGFAVGEAGTALATDDGGASWNPVALPTTQPLYTVDAKGTVVWIGGGEGTAFKSTDGGASFVRVDLGLDTGSDVRAAWVALPDTIYLAGGGGFIRRSHDGGTTWTYGIHSMHGQIADLSFAGGVGYAVSNRFLLPISTIDRGARWRLPNTATLTRSWVQKQPTMVPIRGMTFAQHPTDRKTIYCAMGYDVFRSRDEGETWTIIASMPQAAKTNAFLVSPRDTNVWIAAVAGVVARRLVRTTDHGANWTTVLTHNFGDFGVPLEIDPDHPDTMYFGGDADGLYRSIDRGETWSLVSSNDFTFRSPCDIVVVPGQNNVIVVADGVTGQGRAQYFKSTNGGTSFVMKHERPTGASEIPSLANSRLRPDMLFGTNWGGGGVQKSRDAGETWPNIATTGAAWGTDIARDDPNVVIYGVYSGGQTYTSVDSGATFVQTTLVGTNYGFFARDRGLVLVLQSDGIYKMEFSYSYAPQNGQGVALISPAGGEVWAAGSTHDLTWSASNLALARLEYRHDVGSPWQPIAEVPGNDGTYAWTVPNDPTTDAAIRVVDAWDASPADASPPFTITGGMADVDDGAGPAFGLWQNQPNPFTRSTRIHYALPVASDVTLEVFDLQGQRVATLARGRRDAGVHSVAFGARDAGDGTRSELAAGVYFYRLRAGALAAVRKMLVLE